MYRNIKRRRTVCHPSEPPAFTSKTELPPKNVLLCVVRCVGNNSLGGPASQPNHQRYILQLDRLHSNLVANREDLNGRRGVLLTIHDNARSHAAVITRQKLMGFGCEVLPHLPILLSWDQLTV
ncbi:hypothetical protein TNCV_4765441 [Trichonephila clavipes]|nr:hypothetical protein TNCV_4765441 [Trichonephila clavipes]